MTDTAPESLPELSLDPDTAFFILIKAREFDGKVDESDPDSGFDAADDRAVDVLEDRPSDPDLAEIAAAVDSLNDDERLDLVALIWIGRNDFSLDQWDEARDAARDISRARAARYVTGIPLVSDYLQEGLSRLGYSLSDYLDERAE